MSPTSLAACFLAGATTFVAVPLILDWTDRLDEPLRRELEIKMAALGLEHGYLTDWLRTWRVATLAALIVPSLLGMIPVGVFLALVINRFFPAWLRSRVRRHQSLLETQIPSATRQLSGQLRAGTSLPEAIEEVSMRLPEPLRWHFQKVRQRMAQGAEIRLALEDMRGTLKMESMSLLVTVLKVALEHGGPLAEVLERITRSLQELERVRRKREADTAAGRMMITVLGCFPVGFLLMMTMFNPEIGRTMFLTIPGQILLLVTALITYFSLAWAARIVAGPGG